MLYATLSPLDSSGNISAILRRNCHLSFTPTRREMKHTMISRISEPNALEAVFTTQSIGRWHHRSGSEDVRGEALGRDVPVQFGTVQLLK